MKIPISAKRIPISIERAVKIASKLENAKRNRFPISIQAAIEDKCFNRCPMCEHPNKPVHSRVSGKDWCDFLNIGYLKGLESVCYSGGDPFAHPDINQIMEKHIQLGIEFGMLCSGYVPSSVDLELLKFCSWVRISLDTVDPEIYDKIRGKIKIQKVFDSIDKLLDKGIEVGLSPTIHNLNKDCIIDVLEYAISKNIYVDLKTAYPGTFPIDNINWDIIYPYKDKLKLRLYTGEYYEFKTCSASLIQLFIDAFGDIYPCCTIGGDVTIGVNGDKLGHIKDDWNKTYNNIKRFSELKSEHRPKYCYMCQGRFTEINHIAELIPNNKAFF